MIPSVFICLATIGAGPTNRCNLPMLEQFTVLE